MKVGSRGEVGNAPGEVVGGDDGGVAWSSRMSCGLKGMSSYA